MFKLAHYTTRRWYTLKAKQQKTLSVHKHKPVRNLPSFSGLPQRKIQRAYVRMSTTFSEFWCIWCMSNTNAAAVPTTVAATTSRSKNQQLVQSDSINSQKGRTFRVGIQPFFFIVIATESFGASSVRCIREKKWPCTLRLVISERSIFSTKNAALWFIVFQQKNKK